MTKLHILISEKLRRQILNSSYQPGEQLPSERQLMEIFEVSRITIRRAISNLASQGLVESKQGKGVFVTHRQKVTYSLSSPLIFLAQDMQRQGIHFTSQNLLFQEVAAPKDVKSSLNLSAKSATVYLQKKLFIINHSPGGVDITYILPELGKTYAQELQQGMTFPILEQHNIVINRLDSVLECTYADREMSEYLEVNLGHPLLVFRYTAFTTENRPILQGESLSRGDRFCYSLSVSR
ncbi:MAG: GntR family transcriptional regulator [Jaaginema sp. PMC 1079.18]|nr:GntR family transcriptional regulator [Jaaginema sp. PMC 1080.18]MEC4852403.1 GntR family transcriptional regulator [Jaaginema sp. PMC 1079.18]MEC4867320.1 GntR family transcriptional regulator [Jaaginema sp. PMC 1078.18]